MRTAMPKAAAASSQEPLRPLGLTATGRWARSLLLIIALFLTAAGQSGSAPSYEQVHVALIARCIEHISWAKEPPAGELSFGLLGASAPTSGAFSALAKNVRIRGKNLRITPLNDLKSLNGIDVLYVGESQTYNIARIWQAIEKKNILLVTDRCSDQKYIMLNTVLDHKRGSTSFEINKANAVIEGFDIKPELLLLGGTEVDVRSLYKKMRDDLIGQERRLKTHQEQLERLKARIDSTSSEIERSNSLIAAKESRIQDYEQRITGQESRLKMLADNIAGQQQALRQKSDALEEQEITLVRQKSEIEKQNNEIAQHNRDLTQLTTQISEKENLLAQSMQELEAQSTTMGLLADKLKSQRSVVLLLVVTSLLLLALGFAIMIAYRIKIAANRNLEANVARRTEELNTANLQLVKEIQERERLELERKKSEQDYREIYNSTNEALLIHDGTTGAILDVNETFERMYGYSLAEIKTQPVVLLSSGQGSYTQAAALEKIHAAMNEDSQVFEWHARRKDDTYFWVEVALHRAEIGGQARVIAAVRDISQRKAAEETQRKLEESLYQAEKLNSIGQLAGGIAHDFNNQLAGILGYADILNDELKPQPELQEYTGSIITLVERARDLTGQLLAYARKGKYLTVSVDLHKIIREVASLLEHTIQKNISLTCSLAAPHYVTIGDPSQLQSAILNIGINARDAMPHGGEIAISTELVSIDRERCARDQFDIAPGEFIRLTISDTGTGMDTETMKHIFEPFFTTKELGKGTGMGLAAVFGTVKAHKGTLEVASEIGKGSRFSIYLPLTPTAEPHKEPQKSQSTPSSLDGLRILLVDDDENIRNLASMMFRSQNQEITVCESGRQALELYEKAWREFDVVLLDMMMPEMDGRQLFTRMKAINPDILAILSSGYSLDGDAQQLLDLGVKGFMPKPFRKNHIMQLINELVRKHCQDKAADTAAGRSA